MKQIAWISLAMVACVGAQALGQFPIDGGMMWGGGYRHASTVEEGAQRGFADVIRSAGMANLMNSQAASNYEDARKKYIENRMQATNTYFDMRRVNKEARAAERTPPPTQEQLVRFSQEKLPDRLASSKLDPVTGTIKWPVVLRDAVYEDSREKLEILFAERAKNGYLSPDQYLQVKDLTKGMLAELKTLVRKYPQSASIEARRFIESLAFEANMDPAKS